MDSITDLTTANIAFSKFSRNYMEIKYDLPIRPSEMGVLNILTKIDEEHTPIMIAEFLNVSKPMVTKLLSSLELKGYIERIQSEVDKRSFKIKPTQKALKLVENVDRKFNEKYSNLIKEMGQEDFTRLVALMSTANTILSPQNDYE